MRSRFDEQLAQLERELIEMGALCEESIALAAKSLGDGSLARQVAPLDTEIDRKERDIESLCRAGIPISTAQGAGGGISIMEGYRVDKTLLT